MYEKINQALTQHWDFFDPIHKVVVMSKDMNPVTIAYADEDADVTVGADGSVDFHMSAPNATKVEVGGLGGYFGTEPIALESDGKGNFYKHVPDFPAGMHYYNWYVDGVPFKNPKTGVSYGCFTAINTFEVPEKGEDFYFIKDVPHGTVSICKYVSNVNAHMKETYVYTPYGYEQNLDKKYPVLYIQHGVGEDETGWIWQGKLNYIMDNLIAEGACKEMIVVMSCGYAFEEGSDPVFYPGDFDSELIHSIIPYIEANFRVKKGKNNRAMAGLSLGSVQASKTVADHMDLFSAVGVFSGVSLREVERIAQNDKESVNVVFMSCGSEEKEILERQIAIEKEMQEIGKNCIQKTYTGFHEWHVWRKSLRDLVQLLFRWDDAEKEDMPIYKEQQLPEEQLYKQTSEEQMAFFDPVYKQVYFAVDEEGNPAGRYRDIPHGVKVIGPNKAEFSLFAPGAKSVTVDVFDCGKLELSPSKEHEGYWYGVMDDIEQGFHYMSYEINNTKVLNGDAPVGYGCFQMMNYIELPEENFTTYRLSNCKHGKIHMNYYTSTQTNRQKLCYVYTPADYDLHPEKLYPVLYLQHGGGENEIGWLRQGKIANMADNLIASGKMKEMVIVLNTGYAFREDGTHHPSLSAFDQELVNDCMPFIEERYRIQKGKDYTAMAGLSMGGMQTQKTVFENVDKFGWVGIFSGGLTVKNEEVDYSDLLYHPEKLEEAFHLFFVACGTEDRFFEKTKNSVEDVLAHGTKLDVFFDKGRHDWIFWRHCAADFLTKIF